MKYTCNMRAIFYFAIASKNETVASLTSANIKAKSMDLGKAVTDPDEANSDIVYGYKLLTAAATSPLNALVKEKLKSQTPYFAIGICINEGGKGDANVTHSKKFVNWTQFDNGGRPVVTNITFKQ